MKALTLHPHWAWAVALLGKDVENRAWLPGRRLEVGERFAIHAGRWPLARPAELERFGHHRDGKIWSFAGRDVTLAKLATGDLEASAIVATAVFDGVQAVGQQLESRWHLPGFWGWRLRDVRIGEPVACRGAVGLWNVPAELSALVEAWQQQAFTTADLIDGACPCAPDTDSIHCVCWWDGELPCCRCGDHGGS